MICDAHVHIGQFNELYTSPQEAVSFMQQVGVEQYAVMSTTIWEENYYKVLHEMRNLAELAPKSAKPILWLTPEMLFDGKLDMMLQSGVRWHAIKVHGNHPWSANGVNECACLAEELRLPLILHTGDFPQCEPRLYKNIIRLHPQLTFVLAHCRPIDQTIDVMQECFNCWGDTAFTPLDDLKKLLDAGLEDRILFGTDYPLQRVFFPGKKIASVYAELIRSVRLIMSERQWEKIAHENFEKLYS